MKVSTITAVLKKKVHQKFDYFFFVEREKTSFFFQFPKIIIKCMCLCGKKKNADREQSNFFFSGDR